MLIKLVEFLGLVCGMALLPFAIIVAGRVVGRARSRWLNVRARPGDSCVACGQPIIPPARATRRNGGLRHYYQCPPKNPENSVRLAPKGWG